MQRNRIVYLPYPYPGKFSNSYTQTMVNILRQKYKVEGQLCSVSDKKSMCETKAVILNWKEDSLTEQEKKQILAYKNCRAKIIWVFHNKTVHDAENAEKAYSNICWLADISDYILIHSKHSRKYVPGLEEGNGEKICYLPHPPYENLSNAVISSVLKERYCIKQNNFVFCMFGVLRPYKNIEFAIETFKKLDNRELRLVIAGKPCSSEYGELLYGLAQDDKRISMDFRRLSDLELDSLIGLSDVVLMSHSDKSSMNSGVLIKAMSCGKTAIAPRIAMVQDIEAESDFLYIWDSENIDSFAQQMLHAVEDGKQLVDLRGKKAEQYVKAHHNTVNILEQLMQLLETEEDNILLLPEEILNEINELNQRNAYRIQESTVHQYMLDTMYRWMKLKNHQISLVDWLQLNHWNKVAIYGMGPMGQAVLEELQENGVSVMYAVDKKADKLQSPIPTFLPDDNLPKADVLIVTAVAFYDEIRDDMQRKTDAQIVSLRDILDGLELLNYY